MIFLPYSNRTVWLSLARWQWNEVTELLQSTSLWWSNRRRSRPLLETDPPSSVSRTFPSQTISAYILLCDSTVLLKTGRITHNVTGAGHTTTGLVRPLQGPLRHTPQQQHNTSKLLIVWSSWKWWTSRLSFPGPRVRFFFEGAFEPFSFCQLEGLPFKKTVKHFCLHLHLGHLADTFIQSDLLKEI